MSFPPAPLRSLGPHGTLGPDNRVVIDNVELAVAGWIAYDNEWVEYFLADTTWLCVEHVDGILTLSRWWDRPGLAPEPEKEITVEGHRYRQIEAYTARWRAAGIGDLPGSGQVWVGDYRSNADGRYLAALEDWGDGVELSLGIQLNPGAVTIR